MPTGLPNVQLNYLSKLAEGLPIKRTGRSGNKRSKLRNSRKSVQSFIWQ